MGPQGTMVCYTTLHHHSTVENACNRGRNFSLISFQVCGKLSAPTALQLSLDKTHALGTAGLDWLAKGLLCGKCHSAGHLHLLLFVVLRFESKALHREALHY